MIKPYAPGTLASFKLFNGEELVAKVVETTDTGWIVNSPRTLMRIEDNLGLVPTLMSVDMYADFELAASKVIIHGEAVPAMVADYNNHRYGVSTANPNNDTIGFREKKL